MRYEKRGERPPWPGLEAASTATAACLVGRGPPTAPSCASWTSPLSAPVCFAFRFGDFLLLFLSFALLFGRQPPAEPMFDVYQEAHSGALHRTYRRRTRVHVPPMKQAASSELTADQLATAVAAGSPHRRHSQHHRGGQTCAGAWHTSSSIPPIPRPGGHQDAMRLAITPTHHPRALAHHPRCLWSPVEATGGAAGLKVRILAR